jgi:hypothetical protein
MMADLGAERIRELIETPSAALALGVAAIRSGLEATGAENEAVGAPTYEALEGLRRFYDDLSRQIGEIRTSEGGAQSEALAALKRLDAGLQSFVAGLRQTKGEAAEAELENAHRRLQRGAADLGRAAGRIA